MTELIIESNTTKSGNIASIPKIEVGIATATITGSNFLIPKPYALARVEGSLGYGLGSSSFQDLDDEERLVPRIVQRIVRRAGTYEGVLDSQFPDKDMRIETLTYWEYCQMADREAAEREAAEREAEERHRFLVGNPFDRDLSTGESAEHAAAEQAAAEHAAAEHAAAEQAAEQAAASQIPHRGVTENQVNVDALVWQGNDDNCWLCEPPSEHVAVSEVPHRGGVPESQVDVSALVSERDDNAYWLWLCLVSLKSPDVCPPPPPLERGE